LYKYIPEKDVTVPNSCEAVDHNQWLLSALVSSRTKALNFPNYEASLQYYHVPSNPTNIKSARLVTNALSLSLSLGTSSIFIQSVYMVSHVHSYIFISGGSRWWVGGQQWCKMWTNIRTGSNEPFWINRSFGLMSETSCTPFQNYIIFKWNYKPFFIFCEHKKIQRHFHCKWISFTPSLCTLKVVQKKVIDILGPFDPWLTIYRI